MTIQHSKALHRSLVSLLLFVQSTYGSPLHLSESNDTPQLARRETEQTSNGGKLSKGALAGIAVGVGIVVVVFLAYGWKWRREHDRRVMMQLLQAKRDRDAARAKIVEQGEVPVPAEGTGGQWTQAGETMVITGEFGTAVKEGETAKAGQTVKDHTGATVESAPPKKRKWWEPKTLPPVTRPAHYDPRTGDVQAAAYASGGGF